MKRILFILLTISIFVSVSAITVFGAEARFPWNYEDYIHNVEYEEGENEILVEIPSTASWIMVRAFNIHGTKIWTKDVYGTLLTGEWPYSFASIEGYFDPIDSNRPLVASNIPNGSTVRIELGISGFNFTNDGFNMTLYYLDKSYNILHANRFWQDWQGNGIYAMDFGIDKPAGTEYICIQCPVSYISPTSSSDAFQIEFTRTQLIMSVDALYYQQMQTNRQNKLLDEIANGTVEPSAPADSDKVGDLGNLEESIMDSAQDGADKVDVLFNDAPQIFALYASAFFMISSFMERFISVGWMSNILTVSLALGFLGFIINLGVTIICKGGNNGKGGKGGKQ